MLKLVVSRLLAMVPMLLIVSFGVFLLMTLAPGDPAIAIGGADASPEQIAEIRDAYQLDEPLVVQYVFWLGDVVTFDLGTSRYAGSDVAAQIAERWPATAGVVLASAIVALVIGVPLGVLSGIRPGRAVDGASRLLAGLGLAVPPFVAAIALVVVFGVQRRWLPVLGYVPITESPLQWVRHMVLPALTLGVTLAAVMIRQLRAAMIDVLDSNYVRAAWARGGGPRRVVGVHGLKNAAMPAVTAFGFGIAGLLGGSVIVEEIFSIPGLGPYLLDAIVGRDVPVVQAITLLFVVTQIVMSLLVDLVYGWLNPKIRVV
jgi:peptide/nickel transport system permease protein